MSIIFVKLFFFRGPVRSDDQPPVPHIVPIFSIQHDPARLSNIAEKYEIGTYRSTIYLGNILAVLNWFKKGRVSDIELSRLAAFLFDSGVLHNNL